MQLRALLENYRPAPDELGIPRFVSCNKSFSRQYLLVINVVCFVMPGITHSLIEGLVFANLAVAQKEIYVIGRLGGPYREKL